MVLNKKLTETQYGEWLNNHHASLDDCNINFEVSVSGAMEAAHAVEMWERSEEYELQCTTSI